jgi:hypothetical protein
MSKPLRLPLLAAVLSIVAAATASAQTVILKGAKPGETVQVIVNDAPGNAGTVAADGSATVVGNIPLNASQRPEMDARLYLDACADQRRVLVVNRTQLPAPPADGCTRTEVSGIYWVRQRSTIVIDVSKPIPDVLLRQGSYNPNAPVHRLAPKGLVLFGGGGLAKLSEAAVVACGDVADCSDDGHVGGYSVGATFWVTRWLGLETSYMRPSKIVINGNGGSFTFNNRIDLDVVNAIVKGGLPLGPVRLFGQGGMSYHEARNTMTQTIGEATQTSETHTDGWSYTFGGGLEGWITDRIALYGEAGQTKIKGKERLSEVIRIDDSMTHYMLGVRFRVF